MKYGHTEIFVRDPLAAKAFYTDVLGFELDVVQQEKFVWLRSDGATFLLRPSQDRRTAATAYQTADTAIVLYTDDLDTTKSLLESRGLVFAGTDGSPRCLTFTDPDGNWFQLVNPNEHS